MLCWANLFGFYRCSCVYGYIFWQWDTPFSIFNVQYNPYSLFNEKLKQNSTFNTVEFHIDTKIAKF